MAKIRVGVIGCGSIAKYRHIPEYAENPHVELVAFCDVVEERAKPFADQYGGKVYTDYQELLKDDAIDAVSVCTPNVEHGPMTIAAARAGKHVLCEKPMATSGEEAQAMIDAARENGVVLMIGHNQRLMPPHVKAKEILESGRLGKVLTFRTTFGHGGPEQWSAEGKGGWFFRKERAFVGAMGDLGVHKADLIRWLLQDEIVEVGALVDTLHKEETDVDDNAVIILRTRGGAIGTMEASWTHYPNEDNSTILHCENGTMKIGVDPVDQVIVELRDGTVERYQVGAIATNEEGGQTKSGVIDAFVHSILSGEPPLISGEEGKKSLEVILAAIRSAEEKRIVQLQPTQVG
ncbi:oxidoreductase [Polycladomyces abyssicola]|uniref:Oxidoreductase n=1 Tax=Polycladomyces abyssicola TaxID=1125966 RepID=A0A8D5UGH3_9BACL|nr:Gfo/Idh/MocA family oxidoreductase [Polycladomyces abyssicola]BCU82669.1 oxidoreductase [Polycladomyces abyssicola]